MNCFSKSNRLLILSLKLAFYDKNNSLSFLIGGYFFWVILNNSILHIQGGWSVKISKKELTHSDFCGNCSNCIIYSKLNIPKYQINNIKLFEKLYLYY